MKNKLLPLIILLLSAINFTSLLAQSTTPVTFGANGPKRQGCPNSGICIIGQGVSTTFTWNPVPLKDGFTTGILIMEFNLQDAINKGNFVVPDGPFYTFASAYTFSGNDGTGVPAGIIIPAGAPLLYGPDSTGTDGILASMMLSNNPKGSATSRIDFSRSKSKPAAKKK